MNTPNENINADAQPLDFSFKCKKDSASQDENLNIAEKNATSKKKDVTNNSTRFSSSSKHSSPPTSNDSEKCTNQGIPASHPSLCHSRQLSSSPLLPQVLAPYILSNTEISLTPLAQTTPNPFFISSLKSPLHQENLLGHEVDARLAPTQQLCSTPNFALTPHVGLHKSPSPTHLLGVCALLPSSSSLGIHGIGNPLSTSLAKSILTTDILENVINSHIRNESLSRGLNSKPSLDNLLNTVAGHENLIDSQKYILNSNQSEVAVNAESNESYFKFRNQMLIQARVAKAQKTLQHQAISQHDKSTSDFRSCDELSSDTQCDDIINNVMKYKISSRDYEMMPEDCTRSISGNSNKNSDASLVVAISGDEDFPDHTNYDIGCSSGKSVNNCEDENSNDKKNNEFNMDLSKQNSMFKDDAYWERRRKNNEAAKRSRDTRRAKEDEIAIRAAFLEQENIKLRVELSSLKSETTKLRCLLYNS